MVCVRVHSMRKNFGHAHFGLVHANLTGMCSFWSLVRSARGSADSIDV